MTVIVHSEAYGSDYTVAKHLGNGKIRIRGQISETPEPVDTNFGMGDYVGDDTQHVRIQNDRPSEGVGQIGEILLCVVL